MKQPATTNFHRGTDRRRASQPQAVERRRGDRRDLAIRWITLFRDADPDALDAALAECEVLLLPAGTLGMTILLGSAAAQAAREAPVAEPATIAPAAGTGWGSA